MNKLKTNIIIDVLMMIAFAAMSVTGCIMEYMPTCAGGRGHGAPILGLGRHGWGDIHLWSAIAVLVFLVLHIILHWSMVDAFFKKSIKSWLLRTLLYIFLAIITLATFVPWFFVI